MLTYLHQFHQYLPIQYNSIKPRPFTKKDDLLEKIQKIGLEKHKMNNYEHTFIAKQDLTDSQNQKLIEKYKDIISNNSGKILKTEDWGLRNLSFKTKNNTKGIYFHIKLEGIGKTIEELERAENIDDAILRYLTVKVKKHDLDTNYFEKKDTTKK